MVAIDPFMYLPKYVVGFFLVDTIEIGERVSLPVEGVVNKDETSSSDLYLSCLVLVFWQLTFF